MTEKPILQRITEIVFSDIVKMIKHDEDAEDITQEVLLKLHLKNKDIHPNAVINWARTTAWRASLDFIENRKNGLYLNNNLDKFIEQPQFEIQEDDDLKEEMYENLPKKEQKLLRQYYSGGKNIKKLAEKNDMNYHTLKDHIYFLIRRTKADYNKLQGMTASKQMIDNLVHERIKYFIELFDKCIKEDNLIRMKDYFIQGIEIENIPKLKIKKFIDYDITLIEKKIYIIAVHYMDTDNQFASYQFEIFIPRKKVPIRILRNIQKPQQIIELDTDSMALQDYNDVTAFDKQKGTLQLDDEDLLKIVKKYKPIELVENE